MKEIQMNSPLSFGRTSEEMLNKIQKREHRRIFWRNSGEISVGTWEELLDELWSHAWRNLGGVYGELQRRF